MPGFQLWSGMEMVIESVWQNKRTSVRACHGISKTYSAAVIASVFLNSFPQSIVVTTAPTFRQVERQLWKEINTIYRLWGSNLKGECMMLHCNIADDWFMYGFSTDRAVNVEGHHAPAILFVLDEAKALPDWLYKGIEGSMTGGFSRILEISTTDGADQQMPFRVHHTTKTNRWNCIKLSAFDSPFVDRAKFSKYERHFNEDLFRYGKPRRGCEWPDELRSLVQVADEAWINDRQDEWEVSDPEMWDTKVCGDFGKMSESNVIPLEWINAATNNRKVKARKKNTKFGLDVAEFGGDRNVLTERQGGLVFEQKLFPGLNPLELAGAVSRDTKKRGAIHVDKIGVGSGTFYQLQGPLAHPAIGIESAASAQWDEDQFANLRAEIWWHTRAVFLRNYEEGNVLSIPDDKELIAELAAVKYKIRPDSRILIEDKKEIIKRIGRSPDKGDSFVYCLANLKEDVQEQLPKELEAIMMR